MAATMQQRVGFAAGDCSYVLAARQVTGRRFKRWGGDPLVSPGDRQHRSSEMLLIIGVLVSDLGLTLQVEVRKV